MTFLSAKHIRERKFSSVDLNGIRTFTLLRIFFFFLYTDTLKIRQLKAIVREHPSSFLTAVSIKKVRKMRKEKVIEYYILILIDSISCNNKMESKGIEYFFFYRCTLLFIVTPFDIIIKINVLKVNCFHRVIQLDYALRL